MRNYRSKEMDLPTKIYLTITLLLEKIIGILNRIAQISNFWPLALYYRCLNKRVFDIPLIIEISQNTRTLKDKIQQMTEKCLALNDNKGFFSDKVKAYGHRHWALPFKSEFMLFAPNIAVIDFLVKYAKDPNNETILDYACGLGYLVTYLKNLGFTNLYGYDNFQQVRERSVRCFLRSFGMEDSLITERSTLKRLNPTIICIIGIPYNWLDLDILEFLFEKDSLNFLLLDAFNCRDFYHQDYRLFQKYHGLLHVYKRSER